MTTPRERNHLPDLGTIDNPIVDSALTPEEALAQNPDAPCPQELLDRQAVLDVVYFSFDNKYHKGQLVIDRELEKDAGEIFGALMRAKFPIASVIPISDKRFAWNAEASQQANNTSGFNFQARVEPASLSEAGRAIDINPRVNTQADRDHSKKTVFEYERAGVVSTDSLIMRLFKSRGWKWGGDAADKKDKQRFSKPYRQSEWH